MRSPPHALYTGHFFKKGDGLFPFQRTWTRHFACLTSDGMLSLSHAAGARADHSLCLLRGSVSAVASPRYAAAFEVRGVGGVRWLLRAATPASLLDFLDLVLRHHAALLARVDKGPLGAGEVETRLRLQFGVGGAFTPASLSHLRRRPESPRPSPSPALHSAPWRSPSPGGGSSGVARLPSPLPSASSRARAPFARTAPSPRPPLHAAPSPSAAAAPPPRAATPAASPRQPPPSPAPPPPPPPPPPPSAPRPPGAASPLSLFLSPLSPDFVAPAPAPAPADAGEDSDEPSQLDLELEESGIAAGASPLPAVAPSPAEVGAFPRRALQFLTASPDWEGGALSPPAPHFISASVGLVPPRRAAPAPAPAPADAPLPPCAPPSRRDSPALATSAAAAQPQWRPQWMRSGGSSGGGGAQPPPPPPSPSPLPSAIPSPASGVRRAGAYTAPGDLLAQVANLIARRSGGGVVSGAPPGGGGGARPPAAAVAAAAAEARGALRASKVVSLTEFEALLCARGRFRPAAHRPAPPPPPPPPRARSLPAPARGAPPRARSLPPAPGAGVGVGASAGATPQQRVAALAVRRAGAAVGAAGVVRAPGAQQVRRGRGLRPALAPAAPPPAPAPEDAAHDALMEGVAAWVGGLLSRGV